MKLKLFFSLAKYCRRFINGRAKTSPPLTHLLMNGSVFIWTPDCSEAWYLNPEFTKPFIISMDESKFEVGAILSQIMNAEEHPVTFAS
ncbi:hypothetical protein J437_LFUL017457 [Ladona fulva]|uniref:Reverse transcriptase/retrotransposon-derived protein RNase H-like domain-containing protein n=1 Tax=Ladona fulva TaxID=123851 RepID=A0A8K0KNK3_LADFU|nr:hypothetical protein J437_LFUL017457 [Ladona fulva]